ncbi:biotin-dependent carboxyltransferase family protein [Marinobacter sp. TBZ242]|uniref:Biotin-dependent carboxyltransferase family protein n=1 Tax=Marinobacter azerbaijanicus TaxID=3050455 RepID=A0ABT7IDN7_9GAMM|nr:biotin-dependent carboxyltransferase family protein [Marinobacter sp. TBZ242]MDL0432271.1 biotin-dependent carboxyltransferase family protein [Marinobacter sp. TBZ242]
MSESNLIGFRVSRAGPLALLQDAGRFGVRHLGVTQGGPADLHAWAWANRLTGNAWGAAALEITFGGLELVAEQDLTIALTGANLGTRHNQKTAPMWRTLAISAGDTLTFGTPVNGLRAYLSVAGGFCGDTVLGSAACVVREQLGGFDGQGTTLQEGDTLAVNRTATTPASQVAPDSEQRDYRQAPILELLPGAQIATFTGKSLFEAFNAEWQVDQRADRMGVRLTGPRLQCSIGSLVSEGISLGAVQVPPDGQPIALLNDRQTIGGYPRLGNLTPLAASRLAQCLPGQTVRLRAAGIDSALRQHRQFLAAFR